MRESSAKKTIEVDKPCLSGLSHPPCFSYLVFF